MTVRVYYSTDASAPVLSGTPGSMITLLDACLVTGFGTSVAAGWTKPFSSGSIKAVYKQGVGSNSLFLRVDDTGTGPGFGPYGSRHTRVAGYVTMSDVDTGTNQFPNESQNSGYDAEYSGNAGGCWQKSNSTDASARAWVIVATEKAFYFWSDYNNTRRGEGMLNFFGDFASNVPGDAYNTLLICNPQDLTYTANAGFTNWNQKATQNGLTGHYVARSWTQMGSSMNAGKFYDATKDSQSFPTPVQGKFSLGHWWITDTAPGGTGTGIVRGYLPGMIQPNNWPQFEIWSKYTGTGTLEGREFLHTNTSTGWTMWLEISNTW